MWLLLLPVLAIIAVTAGPFVYINLIKDDPPARLSFEDLAVPDIGGGESAADGGATPTTPAVPAGNDGSDLNGTWRIARGSVVGYRVTEVLFGQDTEGVGRSSGIVGNFVIDGTRVDEATFEVDMRTFESDDSRRDGQFEGRIMDVAAHPTAAFALTQPIELTSIPDDLVEITTTAHGSLTLRGVTKDVAIDIVARRNGTNIEITGSLGIVFDEWGIPNPSNAAVSTNDEGLLELALVLAR
jgi:polyisoprenoid-binding protein YceI